MKGQRADAVDAPLLGGIKQRETHDKNTNKKNWRSPIVDLSLHVRYLIATTFTLSYLCIWWYMYGHTLVGHGTITNIYRFPERFSWDFEGKQDLEFRPCHQGFQCAKLLLPLDYFNSTYPDKTVSIAILKLPAKVPVTDARYGGPVLINPGGPGGSGVSMALFAGQQLQTIIDPAPGSSQAGKDAKYYDIIGFDPRGIGFTEPEARCMPDEPTSFSWQLRQSTEGMLGSSDAALGRLWAMNHAYGASCKQASDAEEDPDIKQYMSTASVATDMLKIAEKHAEWVAKKSCATTYDSDEVKLQYWGFSYGTYLGSTFASMFPDRVGRIVLDGVVNVWDYDNSLGQGSLHDTEKGMKSFYTFCRAAGPEACPLSTSTSSFQDIEHRVQSIIQSLYHDPITISSPDQGPEIFTYSDLAGVIFFSLYSPFYLFPFLAQLLAAVETRGGPLLDTLALATRPAHILHCPLPKNHWMDGNVAQTAILCGEGIDQTSTTISEFQTYWHLLESISPSAGALWSQLRMQCVSWPIKAVYSFGDANNNATHSNYGAPNGTSHPILWLSNTADPVTPLASARIMQARFPGSALAIQDSAGHCSLAFPTACTIARIRNYFQTGGLPDQGSTCVPSASPWSLNSTDPDSVFYDPELGPPASGDGKEGSVSALFETDQGVYQAARHLQRWAVERRQFLGQSVVGDRVARIVKSGVDMTMTRYDARHGGCGYGYRSRVGSTILDEGVDGDEDGEHDDDDDDDYDESAEYDLDM